MNCYVNYTQNKIIEDLKLYKKELLDYILGKYSFEIMSIKELIVNRYIKIIKPCELAEFSGTRKYLSTSSINENGLKEIESIVMWRNKPSRACMKPVKGSVWFAKMKNSVKVFLSENNDEDKYILSTGFYGVICDETYISKYWLKEMFLSDYFNNQKDKFSEGSSMSGIKDNQLDDITIYRFIDKNDERRNTKFFELINRKISIEISLLDKHKEEKKFLLSNMFI